MVVPHEEKIFQTFPQRLFRDKGTSFLLTTIRMIMIMIMTMTMAVTMILIMIMIMIKVSKWLSIMTKKFFRLFHKGFSETKEQIPC